MLSPEPFLPPPSSSHVTVSACGSAVRNLFDVTARGAVLNLQTFEGCSDGLTHRLNT